MHILITGAAGMIGRKLTERLVKDGALNGKPIEKLTLTDVVTPQEPSGFSGKIEARTDDLPAPDVAEKLIAGRPDVIFHLAGVVSGEAELDFSKGYRVNLDGMLFLLEAIRRDQGLSSEIRLHLLDRGLWRAVSAGDPRRIPSHAADLLRHAKGDL